MRLRVLAMGMAVSSAAMVGQTATAQTKGPFDGLAGYWSGQGRLGFKDGKTEAVTCRTTYFVSENAAELKQNIRCASGGAKIEVKSIVRHTAGKLTGTWTETVYDKAGDITGEVTPRGFRVLVKGSEVDASMDIINREARQMIEIQFHDSILLGLTLMLTKGTSETVTGGIGREPAAPPSP
ncbi:MAG: hypothetical protein ACT4N2_03870 [Hyphomicrobium sp.]